MPVIRLTPKIVPGKPYTVTVMFVPALTSIGQYRHLAALGQNHLFVVTGFNKTGATVLTMAPTTAQAARLAIGKTLFQVGAEPVLSDAIITKISAGSPISP